jgi:hypothetical protein
MIDVVSPAQIVYAVVRPPETERKWIGRVANGDRISAGMGAAFATLQATRQPAKRFRDGPDAGSADRFVGFDVVCAVLQRVLALALSIPAALMMVRLFIIQHDCGHGSMFTTAKWNDRIGRALVRDH